MGDVALVNNIFSETYFRNFAFLRNAPVAAVAVTFVLFSVFRTNFFIVCVNGRFYVVASGVRNFYSVAVKVFAKDFIFRIGEMGVDESEKLLAELCFQVVVPWWVKP